MQKPTDFYPFRPSIIRLNVGPLIEAFANQKVVLYVGAGASIPAGLPSWEVFLKQCLRRAKLEPGVDPRRWAFTEKLLNEQHDYLAAAELLQLGLGSFLEKYIWDEFGAATTPSPVHHALARLPASLVITVNYDRLLESAYPNRPNVWTWRDPDAFFSAIRNRRFAIIKSHGDVGNAPSLVLTRTQYRDLMYQNAAFNACFRTLLSLRTFLFVGTSLRDPDLMQQMDSARLTLGPEFGPHYAILFDEEIDETFSRHLRRAYNIHVIKLLAEDHRPPDPEPNEAGLPCEAGRVERSKWCSEMRCRAVVRVLTEMAGIAAKRQVEALPSPPLDDPRFSRQAASQQLIETAVSRTAAFRGDLCFIGGDGNLRMIHRVAEAPMHRRKGACSNDHGETETRNAGPLAIENNTVIGGLFLRQKAFEKDYVYIPDVKTSTRDLEQQGFSGIEYKACHTDIQSELAVPVFSDGQRVGVLNLESEIPDAFTQGHLQVALRIAASAGWVYNEARQRQAATEAFAKYFDKPLHFRETVYKSRLLQHYGIEFFIWRIDYDRGLMVGVSTKDPDSQTRYSFEEKSLATHVLATRKEKYVRDARVDIQLPLEQQILSPEGVKKYKIHGPICGIPVQRGGTTCAILVFWSSRYVTADQSHQKQIRSVFWSALRERIRRLAQLLANSPLREDEVGINAESFVGVVDQALKIIDQGEDSWWFEADNLTEAKRVEICLRLLEAMIDSSTGLKRIRLWLRVADGTFRLVKVMTAEDSRSINLNDSEIDVAGIPPGTDQDPYVMYTCDRFPNDPYARHQHRAMFQNVVDPNSIALHKDRDGTWIVGPIVNSNSLLGYVSADTHRPVPVEQTRTREGENVVLNSLKQRCVMRESMPVSPETQAFQRCVVDVVTDVLAQVVNEELQTRDWSTTPSPEESRPRRRRKKSP